MNLSYGDSAYWNMHYENKMTETLTFQLFEWYCHFEKVYPLITRVMDEAFLMKKVLIIGSYITPRFTLFSLASHLSSVTSHLSLPLQELEEAKW